MWILLDKLEVLNFECSHLRMNKIVHESLKHAPYFVGMILQLFAPIRASVAPINYKGNVSDVPYEDVLEARLQVAKRFR